MDDNQTTAKLVLSAIRALSTNQFIHAILAGILLFTMAAFFVAPSSVPVSHGELYKAISEQPYNLDVSTEFQLRKLTPVCAYYLGFGGNRYIYFTYGLCIVFLAFVYHTVSRGNPAWVAFIAASAAAFGGPIPFQLHFAGYVDITTFIFLWGAYSLRNSSYSGAIIGLSLFNHPMLLFFLPWFIWIWWESRRDWRNLMANILTLGIFVGFYQLWENSVLIRTPVQYQKSFYLRWSYVRQNIADQVRWGWLGAFMGLKLYWIFPWVGTYIKLRERRFASALTVFLPVLCTCPIFLFGSDSQRTAGFALPAAILGVVVVSREAIRLGYEDLLKRSYAWLLFFNFLMPTYYIGNNHIVGMYSVPYLAVRKIVYGLDFSKGWIDGTIQ